MKPAVMPSPPETAGLSGDAGALGFTEIRSTRIASQIGIAVAAIYLIQYLIFGSETAAGLEFLYIALFSLLGGASLLFFLRCRGRKPLPLALVRSYAAFLLLWGAGLTTLDLGGNLDFSAYGVILVGSCAFLGAPVAFYVPLVLVTSGIVLGAFILSPFGNAFFDGFVPIVAYALIGIGLATMRRRERRELLSAWKEIEVRTGRLEELSFKDHLTGLYNRRFFLESLENARSLSSRNHVPLSISILDIDHFKRINDKQGHAVGDLVLVAFARIIAAMKRESDLTARYGGEEFVILLPGADRESALACLERMRSRVAGTSFPEVPWSVTFSAGVAEYDGEESIELLLKRADEALYRAKEAGRDRVM